MGERNLLGRCLEAAAPARLLLREASRGQIFRIWKDHSRRKSRGLRVERRFGIPAMKASSVAAGKHTRKKKKKNNPGNRRDPLSHHENNQCDFSEQKKRASLDCKT